MNLTFIQFHPQNMETVSAEYFAITGEAIQANPPLTQDGFYVVGTSRVKPDHMTALNALPIQIVPEMPLLSEEFLE